MRKACLLPGLLILAAVVASAQSVPVKVLISSRTQPESAGQEAQAIASYFENRVQELLMRQYPCADPLTRSDVSNLLEWDRQRSLLDASYEGGLTNIAGAIGANYYIALTVTPLGSDQVALKASMVNAANAQMVANTTSTTGAGSAALKGVDALAQQLVGSLGAISRFSKEKCQPTNPWMGTVTYLKDESRKSHEGRTPGSSPGDEGVTRINEVDSSYTATIRIGWTGEPKVQVVATETRRIDEVVKMMRDCGYMRGMEKVANLKSAGYEDLNHLESTAAGAYGSVSVSVAKARLRLHLELPEIQGVSKATVRKKFDGGCGDPTSSNNTFEVPWLGLRAVSLTVDTAAGANPDEQAGMFKDDSTGAIVTWKLTRTPMRQ